MIFWTLALKNDFNNPLKFCLNMVDMANQIHSHSHPISMERRPGAHSFSNAAPKVWNSLPQLFECVPVMILSVINSRPTTSSRPSNLPSASLPAPQIRPWLTIVSIYKLYLLTYYLLHSAFVLMPSCRSTNWKRTQIIQSHQEKSLTGLILSWSR